MLQAVYTLGCEMVTCGATVTVAIIPGSEDHKVGIDDFLVERSRSGASPTEGVSCLASLPLDDPAFADAAAQWSQWRGNGKADIESGQSGAVLIRLSDVVPESVTWTWRRCIPAGKITLIDDDPGLVESTILPTGPLVAVRSIIIN